jgi:transposase
LKKAASLVPSVTNFKATRYLVKLRLEPCEAKSQSCSCCGQRVLNRFLLAVVEEDELLGWFVGELLCERCCAQGFWA